MKGIRSAQKQSKIPMLAPKPGGGGGIPLLLDLRRSRVQVEGAVRQVGVIGSAVEVALAVHVAVVESGDGKRGLDTVHEVIVVILLSLFVLVLIERVAPLKGAPQGEMGLGVHFNFDRVVL